MPISTIDATSTGSTGTVMVSGNMPAFSAYLAGSSQSVTTNVNTVAVLDTKEYDTATCFNNTGSTVTLNGLSVPAYSFCPNVPGYYQVSAQIRFTASSSLVGYSAFQLNGGVYYRFFEITTAVAAGISCSGSALIKLNGTGDYIQLAGLIGATSPLFQNSGSPYTSRLQAVLVRAA